MLERIKASAHSQDHWLRSDCGMRDSQLVLRTVTPASRISQFFCCRHLCTIPLRILLFKSRTTPRIPDPICSNTSILAMTSLFWVWLSVTVDVSHRQRQDRECSCRLKRRFGAETLTPFVNLL